jgi:hypothetical protein
MLRGGIERSRRQMSVLSASADAAATHVTAGGRLYAAGTQTDFARELIDRAGGLVGIAPVPRQINRGDVILYAARSRLGPPDQERISTWRGHGAYVVAFASASLSDNPYFPPNALIDSGDREGLPLADGRIAPADSVLNIINAWAWTGEFVAACTRRDRMPVLLQTYHLPGGPARAMRYHGRVFHDDLTVDPIPAGTLGGAYLDRVDGALAAMGGESLDGLARAGTWVREATREYCALQIMAHIFPEHAADPRAPQPFVKVSGLVRPESSSRVVVALGYQYPTQLLIDAARLHRFKLLYTSVERARDDRSDDIVYVNPHWPIDDGCVLVKGYDIPILPASAVAQAAIYWSVVAEAVGEKKELTADERR